MRQLADDFIAAHEPGFSELPMRQLAVYPLGRH